jgi:hypothetical protein
MKISNKISFIYDIETSAILRNIKTNPLLKTEILKVILLQSWKFKIWSVRAKKELNRDLYAK